jgi:penicillin-binding protein-related factor A (putative recombinase)
LPLEKVIIKKILDWLNAQTMCRAIKVHGGPYGNTGEPDIDCVWHGHSIKIEVKQPDKGKKSEPTELQAQRMKEWQKVGGIAFHVTSLEQVRQFFHDHSKGFFTGMKVRCPECGKHVIGTITHMFPFNDYYAKCPCGYLITESDWDIVKSEDV